MRNKILKGILIVLILAGMRWLFLSAVGFDDDKVYGDLVAGVYGISNKEGDTLGELQITALDSKRANFYLYRSTGRPSYNQGELYSTSLIDSKQNQNVTYHYTDKDNKCSLSISVVSKKQATISVLNKQGQCGFGGNIVPGGVYPYIPGKTIGGITLLEGKKLFLDTLKIQ